MKKENPQNENEVFDSLFGNPSLPPPPLIQASSVHQTPRCFIMRLVRKIWNWLVTTARISLKKCFYHSIDRIGALHDDLLVKILSSLTLKEAATTSVLSRRWRYVWTLTPKLDFDFTKSLRKIELRKMSEALLNCERRQYVRWVDRVLASRYHHNATINEFRVSFDLPAAYRKSLDKWLVYALSRKVERLELDLTDKGSREGRSCDECYVFPNEFMRTDLLIHFECLKWVSLNFVSVGSKEFDFLLCNCTLLEELSVSHSYDLYSITISGVCSSLKRLEISYCDCLTSVEIHDSNLVCLKYQGPTIRFSFENVPMLVEIFIGGNQDVLFGRENEDS